MINDGCEKDEEDAGRINDETIHDAKSNSLTEILSIMYVTIVMIALFLKIMFG